MVYLLRILRKCKNLQNKNEKPNLNQRKITKDDYEKAKEIIANYYKN